MDSATVDLYLQKIEGFVHDEDKIVTFKWLSIQLGISVQDSKQLLKQYVTDQRDLKPDALSVTYSLTGLCSDNNLAVTVVKENELEDKRHAFTTILDQEIYSVQKSKDSDLTAVSLVDYFDMHNPMESPVLGSIRSKHSIKRIFKTKKALPPPREPTIKGKVSVFMKAPQKSSEKSETAPSNSNQAPVKEITKTTKPNKQNGTGIASFFNKSLSQADAKQKTQDKPVKEENTQSKKKPAVKEDVTPKSSVEKIQNLVDTDSETEESSTQSSTSKPSKENQKPKRNNKRQRKENKKNARSPKRRKRIVEQEESDDDIFGNDEENRNESVIQDSDEDPEPVASVKSPPLPKNKKRKLVDRTFTDEDGYIITRKEYIEESPSEDESEQIKKDTEGIKLETEQVKTELKRKATDDHNHADNKKMKKSVNDVTNEKVANGKVKNAKGKKGGITNQPTLMNFFKRS